MTTSARISSTNPNPGSHQKEGTKLQLSQAPLQYMVSTPNDRSRHHGCVVGSTHGCGRPRNPNSHIPKESGS